MYHIYRCCQGSGRRTLAHLIVLLLRCTFTHEIIALPIIPFSRLQKSCEPSSLSYFQQFFVRFFPHVPLGDTAALSSKSKAPFRFSKTLESPTKLLISMVVRTAFSRVVDGFEKSRSTISRYFATLPGLRPETLLLPPVRSQRQKDVSSKSRRVEVVWLQILNDS